MSLRDLGVLIAICLVWAGNSVMSKVLISQFGVPPLFHATGRFVVVVIATLPWLLPAPRPLWRMVVVDRRRGRCGAWSWSGSSWAGEALPCRSWA